MPSRRELLAASATATVLSGCLGRLRADNDDDSTLADGLDPTGEEPEDTTAVSQFQQDAQNTGMSNGEPSTSMSVAWRVDTDSDLEALVSTTDTVFLVRSEGLWAYDAESGDPRWSNPFYLVMTGTPAVSPDTVYVPVEGPGTIRNGTAGIAAFDIADGRARWRAATDLHVATSLTLHDGTLYACGYSDHAYAVAVDATTGEEQWREPIEDLAVGDHEGYDTDEYWDDTEGRDHIARRLMAPAVAAETVYVAAGRPPALIALDTPDGSEQWRVPLDNLDEHPQRASVGGAPTVYDGTVYIGTSAGGLYAIDEAGELQWAEAVGDGVTESVAADASGLYVPAARGTRNPPSQATVKLGHDGTLQWTVEVGHFQLPPTLTDRYVLSGYSEPAVIRRKTDGNAVWSFDPESESWSDVTARGEPEEMAVVGDRVYIATDTRHLIAFQ